ncbi:MAG: SprB repeat-containing protein [Bacteroidetes bacterium]|nr:SprB repeat-containing protein [Bacteroidota bacterium]
MHRDTSIAIEPALNSLIVLPAEVTSVSCGNNSDGSINISIAGGQLPILLYGVMELQLKTYSTSRKETIR